MQAMGSLFVGMEPILVWATQTSATRGADGRRTVIRLPSQALVAVVNPVPGRVLATLPEGERTGDQRRVLCDFDIASPDEDTRTWGAILEIAGVFYEVRDKQTYRRVIPHFAYRVRRLDAASVPTLPTP